MNDMRELYQEVIVDHNRHPRNFGKLDNANYHADGFNPLCGDKLSIYMLVENNIIKKIMFEGSGCAISTASSSLMTELLLNKTMAEAEKIFKMFHHYMVSHEDVDLEKLGKLAVLAGVREYPSRVKCATLAWHTATAALHKDTKIVSTE